METMLNWLTTLFVICNPHYTEEDVSKFIDKVIENMRLEEL